MRYILLVLTIVLAAGCASTPSPFFDNDPKWQVEGATKKIDPERELLGGFTAIKAMRAGASTEFVGGLAGVLDTAASDNVTSGALGGMLNSYVDKNAKHPEDRRVGRYFATKLSVSDNQMSLPLTPERKRVLGVYARALRDAVDEFKAEKK